METIWDSAKELFTTSSVVKLLDALPMIVKFNSRYRKLSRKSTTLES